MKICVYSWYYLWILLRLSNVSDRLAEKIKTHFMFSNFFPKIGRFMTWCGNTVYGTARQATDGNIIRFAWWICNATNKQAEYVVRIALTTNSCYANAPQNLYTFCIKERLNGRCFCLVENWHMCIARLLNIQIKHNGVESP